MKPNIPTDYGEIRGSDQYVVVAGSYVKTTPESLKEEMTKEGIPENVQEVILQDPLLGVYTVEQAKPPITITYEQLPAVFLEQAEQSKKRNAQAQLITKTIKPTGKHSALFDLKITEVVTTSKARETHPLHASETGQNFSISGELATCWRHAVSLNAIQFLVVKSGFMSCLESGTPHKNTGTSGIKGNDGAIFHAWLQAKRDNLIPKKDPIPVRAMKYVAVKHKLIPPDYEGMLPKKVYNEVIRIMEEGRY